MSKINGSSIKASYCILMTIFLCSACYGAMLEIDTPKNRSIIPSTRAVIQGRTSDINSLKINGTPVTLENNGNFTAVALLRPGKNLLNFSAIYKGGKNDKTLRILRIVTFDDIDRSYAGKPHWAKTQIISLASLGVIEGYPDNSFQPDKPITRGEFATWLVRARGLKVFTPKEDIYYDVPKEHWRAPQIKAIAEKNWMPGTSKDTFGIDDTLKRSEAVAILARAYDLSLQSLLTKAPFADVAKNSKAAADVYSAYNKGLVIGVNEKGKIFEPEREMKRAEVAVLLSRLENIKIQKASLYDFSKGYSPETACRIGTKPVIRSLSAEPDKYKPDGATPVQISANISDAQGAQDISQVWVDLTPLKGPNNSRMSAEENGPYTLTFVPTTELESGIRNLSINALDKSGLKSTSYITITIIGGKK